MVCECGWKGGLLTRARGGVSKTGKVPCACKKVRCPVVRRRARRRWDTGVKGTSRPVPKCKETRVRTPETHLTQGIMDGLRSELTPCTWHTCRFTDLYPSLMYRCTCENELAIPLPALLHAAPHLHTHTHPFT